MAGVFVHEVRAKVGPEELREALPGSARQWATGPMWGWRASSLLDLQPRRSGSRSSSSRPDTLKFSQQFSDARLARRRRRIGGRLSMRRSRGACRCSASSCGRSGGVVGTLGYLSIGIDVRRDHRHMFRRIGMMTQLAFLDLAAKACPKHAEGRLRALMSVYNSHAGITGHRRLGSTTRSRATGTSTATRRSS